MELQLNLMSLFTCLVWPVYLLFTSIGLNALLISYGLELCHLSKQPFNNQLHILGLLVIDHVFKINI